LPLYGHELGGEHGLNPADAGFSSYVKLSKPFFVGKLAFAQHEQTRTSQVVRFRLNTLGARPPHPGDIVMDANGKLVGFVTSCSIDSEGYQLGQALLHEDVTADGTAIHVMVGGSASRTPVAAHATVISRFPSKKKA
jgi:glycine hydroxymethyltransferase